MGDLGVVRGIYRITIESGDMLRIRDTHCPYSLALDYSASDLYWLDGCTYQLETSKVDGSNFHHIQTGANNFFPYGTAVYDGHVYWTQAGVTSSVDCYEVTSAQQNRVYSITSSSFLEDIQIIHPLNQPPGKKCSN